MVRLVPQNWNELGFCLAVLIGATWGNEARSQAQTPQQIDTPYSRYAPYYPVYGWDRSGGYVRGAADVIRSQGEIMVYQQQAYLMREQVRSAAIDNRRKKMEQALWELNNLPTPEDYRQRYTLEQLRHNRSFPHDTEIWSGSSLNALLKDIWKFSPPVPDDTDSIDPEHLGKLNPTSERSHGNLHLLKDGKVPWPQLLLHHSEFEEPRVALDRLIADAIGQAPYGKVGPAIIEDLQSRADSMRQILRPMAKSPSYQQYPAALKFLNELDDTIKTLREPEAADILSGKYAARGKTIAELVAFLKSKGYIFGPALDDGKAAYRAIYIALRNYDEHHGTRLSEMH